MKILVLKSKKWKPTKDRQNIQQELRKAKKSHELQNDSTECLISCLLETSSISTTSCGNNRFNISANSVADVYNISLIGATLFSRSCWREIKFSMKQYLINPHK